MTVRKYTSRSQQTTLTSAITSGATSMAVSSATTLLATVGSGEFINGATFTVVIDPDTAIEEIVDITAASSNTFTITRSVDAVGTAQDHSAGAVVRHMIIGRDLREPNEHIESTGQVHGLASTGGVVVGTAQTQTLTNKTLTTPIVAGATLSGTITSTAIISGGTLTGAIVTGLTSSGMADTQATPKNYVDAILGSATAAATSAASAATSASSAATSASSAATSASSAATSASSALTSQTVAATSASSAATSATSAANSATTATTQAAAASTSASSASASASAASTSATSAAASASAASTSATSAAASATAASTSASSAATSASSAAASTSAAATSAASAAASATAAATSATSAAASATTASNSAATAVTQATNAATSASSALTSQTAAATSATSAAASATAAATSATSAATSATSAAASATAAASFTPSQTGNSGKFLTTNGTSPSWASVDALPLQTGNAGEFLTTDGTSASWAVVAGSLAQPTEPSSPTDGQIWVDTDGTALINQLLRWSVTPAGGTTTLSGNDNNSLPLTYSVGYEQVFQNGVLLVRGSNYTATNGTSISLSNASVTGDVFEVFAAQPVAISDVYTQAQANAAFIPDSIVTTKGDIIVATGSGTVVRQGVGADNSFLVADSAQADGVKWATATEQYPWTSFTPTLNNWTLGNGTVVGKYQQIGKTINLFFKFTFGSTSSLSSFPNFALPINAANTLGQNVTINLQDAGTADNAGNVYLATNTVYPGAFNTAGTYISVVPISATVPFTWTTNDTITVQFTYEAV